MDPSRRTLLLSAVALAPLLSQARALANPPPSDAMAAGEAAHADLMAVPGLKMHGTERVSILLYPGFTALDVVGPHYFLACMMGATVELVTTEPTLAPLESDLQLAIVPTHTLATSTPDPDVLLVGGGTAGTLEAMTNPAVIAWIKDRGAKAKHVTSVCTGALLLGRAGLLQGKRATAHWVVRDALRQFGAIPVDRRIVTDGTVTTAAGVTAGLDFALALVAQIRGEPYARALALQAEYAPEPPFDGGTPDSTPPEIATPMRAMFAPLLEQIAAIGGVAP